MEMNSTSVLPLLFTGHDQKTAAAGPATGFGGGMRGTCGGRRVSGDSVFFLLFVEGKKVAKCVRCPFLVRMDKENDTNLAE